MEASSFFGAIGKFFGSLLSFFGQKLFVYIEVTANAEPPFRLVVVNNSRFIVHLENLDVDPDGFPEIESGWKLGHSSLFTEKDIVPGQRIMVALSHKNLGDILVRKFTAHYKTKLFGWKVPRKEQSYEHTFDKKEQGLNLVITIPKGKV